MCHDSSQMQVHYITPYSNDKNLGASYNKAMSLLPDDDFACIRDIDTMFLTPDQPAMIQEYAKRNPDAGILTCFTNRISPLSKAQLLNGILSDNTNIRDHIELAHKQKEQLYNTTEIDRDISGFMMVISKKTWLQHPFPELGKALGTDTHFGRTVRAAGLKILRCDGIYLFHIYRLMNGISDKTHLQV